MFISLPNLTSLGELHQNALYFDMLSNLPNLSILTPLFCVKVEAFQILTCLRLDVCLKNFSLTNFFMLNFKSCNVLSKNRIRSILQLVFYSLPHPIDDHNTFVCRVS